jgi:hypothetical protein
MRFLGGQNLFFEPTPRMDGRQFGSGGVITGGTGAALNAEIETEDGADLLETEDGKAIATEQ